MNWYLRGVHVDTRCQSPAVEEHRHHGDEVQMYAHGMVLGEEPVESLHLKAWFINDAIDGAVVCILLPSVSGFCRGDYY